MDLVDKTILLISPEGWGDNYVSKHHYANTLARKGNKVYFLNPPSSKWSVSSSENKVKIVNYRARFRGVHRMPFLISALFNAIEIRGIERKLEVRFEIIWNFDSSRFFNLSKISNHVLKICHLVDLNQDFQRPLLAGTSNICFGTTGYIVEKLKKYNPMSFKIGHGYQYPEQTYSDFHFKMPGQNRMKALYVGNLAMKYIDWKVLLESAQTHSAIDFVFVGPDGLSNLAANAHESEDKIKIQNLSNVYFCGPVHSKYIPQLLKMADALLIAYKEEYHADQAAPHKMVEYLASRKPIIATYTEEFDSRGAYEQLVMTRKNKDFPSKFSLNLPKATKHKMIPSYEDRVSEIRSYIQSI